MESQLIAKFRCPTTWCQAENQLLIHDEAKKLVEKGKIPENEYYLRKEIVNLVPPQAAVLTIPCFVITRDVCSKCGTEYTVMVEYAELPVTGTPNPKKN